MTSAELLPPAILKRTAVVYVRQSTQSQVMTNLESRRRQYDLVDVARQRGFVDVEVIDDDLGRSASGTVARPGFERLVAWLCAGKVGAVLCFDASRLARNGRDWHHLLELCGLVEARVIDHDGVYNPCHPNDRLLLGMKGSISEFELGVLRARMLDAARSKAGRGELRISGACRKREWGEVHRSLAIAGQRAAPSSEPAHDPQRACPQAEARSSRRLPGPALRGCADRAGGLLVPTLRAELSRHRGDAPGAWAYGRSLHDQPVGARLRARHRAPPAPVSQTALRLGAR